MIEYITIRNLLNKKGEKKGRIRIIKLKENDFAEIEFLCPECKKFEKRKEKWKEPFVKGSGKNQKFFVKCNFCNFFIKLEKLRKEIKKR